MAENSTACSETVLAEALTAAGRDERLRHAVFEALRQAELASGNPAAFRRRVRWPLVQQLLQEATNHQVTLRSGLVFEVSPASRIEQALLLSAEARPDHVWEPQTTRLLTALAAGAQHVLVGGAYIGDQVLPIARVLAGQLPPGTVHAFEPMDYAHQRLLRNLELNGMANVVVHRLGLWDRSQASLTVTGPAALGASVESNGTNGTPGEMAQSISIDDYVQAQGLASVGLIMLDTEGGEERALRGAGQLLARPGAAAPHLVFEVHRQYVDWTDGLPRTPIIRFLAERGYTAFAIRDFHDNYSMAGRPIEVIPLDRIYLEGPPHGFNVLATKDPGLVRRLELSVVADVSPKLLLDKDPALHHPRDGMALPGVRVLEGSAAS